jgi:hypothetical protein
MDGLWARTVDGRTSVPILHFYLSLHATQPTAHFRLQENRSEPEEAQLT